MTLEYLNKEMVSAFKAKNKDRKGTISSLIGSAKNIAMAKTRSKIYLRIL